MNRPLLEFRLDATSFGPRAPELLQAALDRLMVPATLPSRCAAAILTAEGTIHVDASEALARESVRHAMTMTVMRMLRTDERRILMAVIVRQEGNRPPRLMLPCGSCRMLLFTYGGPDIRIVHASTVLPRLTLVELNELLPLADGGPGCELPAEALKMPQE